MEEKTDKVVGYIEYSRSAAVGHYRPELAACLG